MYAAMIGRKLSSMRARAWRATVMRSGMLTALILIIFLGGLILLLRERGRGDLHRLQTELQTKNQPPPPAIPPPGGQDAILLKRTPQPGSALPEFLSATLLPGRGMNVLQIIASIPNHGEVSLLASPSMEQAAQQLSGAGYDAQGAASLAMGGAFEVPWAGDLGGVPTPDDLGVMSVWQGTTLILPATPRDANVARMATGGLLLKRPATKIETTVIPDGWQTRSVYSAGSFDTRWLSQTEITTQVLLNGRVIELGMTAKNVGPVAEPLGIGWHPRFAIPAGDSTSTLLHLPESMRLDVRESGAGAGLPSGKLLPVAGTEYDFTKQGGIPLKSHGLDGRYVHLKPGMLDPGPAVEVRYGNSKFGLRLTSLTSTIKEIHVLADINASTVTIDPQFNYDDPLGKQWPKDEDSGMVVLQPGQSTQWKVRLELFPLNSRNGPPF
jgi:aldose 1-epimerase